MKVAIVYGSEGRGTSRSSAEGTNHSFAEAMADALRSLASVELRPDAPIPQIAPDTDLLIVGGLSGWIAYGSVAVPTERFIESLGDKLHGMRVAAFGIMEDNPWQLSFTTPAEGIAARLEKGGGKLVAPPENFYVETRSESRDETDEGVPLSEPVMFSWYILADGEAERAGRWALGVASGVAAAPA